MEPLRKIQNVLVTGGAGFIGSAFIRQLLDSHKEFKGVCVNLDVLTYAGNLENLRLVEKDPRYVFVKGDICDQALVEGLCVKYAIDAIIHFAAESHVDRSIESPHSFLQTNVMGTFHLLEVVRRFPHIHFHHVSTDEVFGSLGETGAFREDSSYQPNSPYAASKAASDHLVRAYAHTYGLSVCISNCSNNYGPFQFPEKFIPLVILNCLQKKPLPVYGHGLNVRDWLFVDDHAAALYMLLQYGKKGETYNIGGDAEWRNIDVVYEIIHVMSEMPLSGSKALQDLVTFVADRPGHDFRYAMDCAKIKAELGWKPSVSFASGLKKTIAWYVSNQEWIQHVQSGAYKQWIERHYK